MLLRVGEPRPKHCLHGVQGLPEADVPNCHFRLAYDAIKQWRVNVPTRPTRESRT